MEVGSVTNISEVHTASHFKVEVEVACTSATFSTMPISTRCKLSKAQLTSQVNHCETLKSVVTKCPCRNVGSMYSTLLVTQYTSICNSHTTSKNFRQKCTFYKVTS
jgi:hypothetical protein